MTDEAKPTHLDVAEDIMANHIFITPTDGGARANEEVFFYDGGVYRPGAEFIIRRETEKAPGVVVSNSFVEEVLGHARRLTYVLRSEIDKDPWVLNVKNGFLDIRTGKLRPHGSYYRSITQINAEWHEDASAPDFKAFMEQILPDVESRFKAYEMIAYCLWPSMSFQKGFILQGSGRNGKTTLLGVLNDFLGDSNVSHVSFHDLEYDRFAAARLYGKVANIYNDISKKAIESTGNIKQLNEGAPIDVQLKFRDRFSLRSRAKLIFSSNVPPEVSDSSTAWFRRWQWIAFTQEFKLEEETPEGDIVADRELITKLTSPDTLSGVLKMVIPYLRCMIARHRFLFEDTPQEVEEAWGVKADHFREYSKTCLSTSETLMVLAHELYPQYRQWAAEAKIATPLSDKKFYRRFHAMFPNMKSGNLRIGGKQTKVWLGLTWARSGLTYSDGRNLLPVTAVTAANLLSYTNDTPKDIVIQTPVTPVTSSKDSELEAFKKRYPEAQTGGGEKP
jgi:putative DNA primase/helicase